MLKTNISLNSFKHLAATNEQRQRIRTPSINSSSDSLRRPTLSSVDLSSTPMPSNVCSISSGPLVRSPCFDGFKKIIQ